AARAEPAGPADRTVPPAPADARHPAAAARPTPVAPAGAGVRLRAGRAARAVLGLPFARAEAPPRGPSPAAAPAPRPRGGGRILRWGAAPTILVGAVPPRRLTSQSVDDAEAGHQQRIAARVESGLRPRVGSERGAVHEGEQAVAAVTVLG